MTYPCLLTFFYNDKINICGYDIIPLYTHIHKKLIEVKHLFPFIKNDLSLFSFFRYIFLFFLYVYNQEALRCNRYSLSHISFIYQSINIHIHVTPVQGRYFQGKKIDFLVRKRFVQSFVRCLIFFLYKALKHKVGIL